MILNSLQVLLIYFSVVQNSNKNALVDGHACYIKIYSFLWFPAVKCPFFIINLLIYQQIHTRWVNIRKIKLNLIFIVENRTIGLFLELIVSHMLRSEIDPNGGDCTHTSQRSEVLSDLPTGVRT